VNKNGNETATYSKEQSARAKRPARVYDPGVFSPSEIVINRALDVLEAWVDRYVVTPLLGPDRSAAA
jgi:hypothetical protein